MSPLTTAQLTALGLWVAAHGVLLALIVLRRVFRQVAGA